MNRKAHIFSRLLLTLVAAGSGAALSACFYEYPVPSSAGLIGEDPGAVTANVEVAYELSWEEMIHYATKASSGQHRIIIEVRDEDKILTSHTRYLRDEEFYSGSSRHNVTFAATPGRYKIAVWYDRTDDEGAHSFSADNLSNIFVSRFSSTDATLYSCAYGNDILDLQDISGASSTIRIEKKIILAQPGARFEVVATDVQQFIAEQKAALLQGDKFNVSLHFGNYSLSTFNAHSGSPIPDGKVYTLSGRMRLPFDDYTELKIAEGFLFCDSDNSVDMKIRVINSVLSTVSETDFFSFPVKKGYNTVIYGDFLTHHVDGAFSIDHIWQEDIVIDVD